MPRRPGLAGRLLLAAAALALPATLVASLPDVQAEEQTLHPPRVEQWRPLVEKYWGAAGYGDEVEYALMILYAESTGVPTAVNPRSNASGLFQHLPKYWAERSRAAGWAGADIFDPEANIAVAAWLRATSPSRGWRHWEPTHDRFPVGSWGPDTHWDTSRGRYVRVGGGTASLGGAFVESGPALALDVTRVATGTGDPPEVTAGEQVVWTYEATNTGEAALWALYLWDDDLGEVGCPEDALAPGESVTCTATGIAVPGEQRARVLAFAWDDAGREVSASAEGAYLGVLPAGAPSDPLRISVAGASWEDGDDPLVRSYLIRNTGLEPLWALYVWDEQLGEVACPMGDLPPGAGVICWQSMPADEGTTVTAWAWTDDGRQLEAVAEVGSAGR